MSGLLPDEQLRNKSANEPWKKVETDRMLDLYFAGTHISRIAAKLGRNPKAIARRIQEFTYNERDRVVRYEPRRRVSRKGKRLTENERVMIRVFNEKHLPMDMLAKVLQRDLAEIEEPKKNTETQEVRRYIGVGVDMVRAYQYIYYCAKKSAITDKEYDDLKAEEAEFAVGADTLKAPASSFVGDYPPHIRSLALYLMARHLGWDEL